MTAIFLSDVHLTDGDSVKTRLVIRFFQEVASQFERVYVLGDLFDVWPGTSSFLLKNYQPVLETLKKLVKDGHEVHFIEGNHDFRLGDFFRNDLGIFVHENSHEETWNGKKIFMMHGDLGNPKDYKYKVLRSFLRQDLLHLAMKAVPSEWVFGVGLKSSSMSRGYQNKRTNNRIEAQIRQTYRNTAESLFQKGYDIVLMGHTHLPDDVSTIVEGRSCRYINTGDWVRNFTYVEYDGKDLLTKKHPLIYS